MTDTRPSLRIVSKPILPVADMSAAVAFYEGLGFEVEVFDEGYAWVRHGHEELFHLRLVADLDPAMNMSSVYFHVLDVDAWHRSWLESGVTLTDAVDQPWEMREFSFTDPSGNLIRVGQNL